ncbi:hypothetical protein BDV25DRAFT_166060 [Aspergillus avenaceus]|uniref:Uncharacterized protein n=1 Tax=Aspergillus avenaceus TaxID=36643 RepID=A0A5N6TER4_ASPAV|nr:hypothetical protein BDV25DRAFT_166060 [Aspergillus avenaceus]
MHLPDASQGISWLHYYYFPFFFHPSLLLLLLLLFFCLVLSCMSIILDQIAANSLGIARYNKQRLIARRWSQQYYYSSLSTQCCLYVLYLYSPSSHQFTCSTISRGAKTTSSICISVI